MLLIFKKRKRTKLWVHVGAMAAAMVFGCARSEPVDDDADLDAAELCEPHVADNECDVCLKDACCQPYAGCLQDPNCACILHCTSVGDTREVCEARCMVGPAEINRTIALLTGDELACDALCDDACPMFGLDDVDPEVDVDLDLDDDL